MSVQSPCLTCGKLKSSIKTELKLKGTIKKLCRMCKVAPSVPLETETQEPMGFVDSFIHFTSEYGYIIALVLGLWVVHASLHRHEGMTSPQISRQTISAPTGTLEQKKEIAIK